uniref:Uncharacterized protein n=1 Tax=Ditylenchus dipsaci TaxID=166011 RepID=A0A915CZC1_9BILA
MLKDIGGHLYWKILSRGKRTYWRCTFFQTGWDGTSNTKCGGKGLTSDEKFELTLAHNHYGDENRIEAKRFQGIIQSKQFPAKSFLAASSAVPSKKFQKKHGVPKDFKMFYDEVFLKFDRWNGAERVLIFSTNKCLDLLVAEKNIGADGTCLLTDRKKETYEFVLKKLVELRPELSPKSIAWTLS